MAIFQSFVLVLLAAAVVPRASWGCESQLESSALQLRARNLILANEARHKRSLVEHAIMFPIMNGPNHFWTLVFDYDSNHRNEGFVIRGTVRGSLLVGSEVERSNPGLERFYFKAIADAHNLPSRRIQIEGESGQCALIDVSGWVGAKLFLKHGLTVDSVSELLKKGKPEWTLEEKSYERCFRARARDANGKSVVVIVSEKDSGANVLVTAFVESTDQR